MRRVLQSTVLGLLAACAGASDTGHADECLAPSQGVWGAVLWLEGNHMPSDGGTGGTSEPMSTTVAAFPVIASSGATEDRSDPEAYGRYDLGDAEAVATVTADEGGCYALELAAGSYTIVADDSGAWFCNSFSPDGLCVVAVSDGDAVLFDIAVDYRAAY